MPHAVCAGDDHVPCHADEEAVFGDAGAGVECLVQRSGIGDGTEVAVEDDIALVGGVGLVAIHAQGRCRAQIAQIARLGMPAEGEDLDRHCPGRAELVGKFRLVDHDDQALGGLGDDFFPAAARRRRP